MPGKGLGDRLAAELNGRDHHPSQLLSMASLATGFFLPPHFIDQDLGPPAMGHHLELHAGSFDIGLPKGGSLGPVDQQHGVDGERATHLRLQSIDVQIAIGL